MIPDLFHGPVTPVVPIAEAGVDGDGSAFAALLEAAAGPAAAAAPQEAVPSGPAPERDQLAGDRVDSVPVAFAAAIPGGLAPRSAAVPVAPPPGPGQPPPIPREPPTTPGGAGVQAPAAATSAVSPEPRHTAVPELAVLPAPAAPQPVAPPGRRPGPRLSPVAPTESPTARVSAAAPWRPGAQPPARQAPVAAAPTAPAPVAPVPPAQPAPAPAPAAGLPSARPEPDPLRAEAPGAGPAPAGTRAVAPEPAAAPPPAAPPPAAGLTERVVRVVEEQARLAPPRTVVVELGGDARLTVALRGTEIHLAWDHPATADLTVLQREVSAALIARGFDLGRGHPDRPPARAPVHRPGARRRFEPRRENDGLML